MGFRRSPLSGRWPVPRSSPEMAPGNRLSPRGTGAWWPARNREEKSDLRRPRGRRPTHALDLPPPAQGRPAPRRPGGRFGGLIYQDGLACCRGPIGCSFRQAGSGMARVAKEHSRCCSRTKKQGSRRRNFPLLRLPSSTPVGRLRGAAFGSLAVQYAPHVLSNRGLKCPWNFSRASAVKYSLDNSPAIECAVFRTSAC
jgi:hypothetical protein